MYVIRDVIWAAADTDMCLVRFITNTCRLFCFLKLASSWRDVIVVIHRRHPTRMATLLLAAAVTSERVSLVCSSFDVRCVCRLHNSRAWPIFVRTRSSHLSRYCAYARSSRKLVKSWRLPVGFISCAVSLGRRCSPWNLLLFTFEKSTSTIRWISPFRSVDLGTAITLKHSHF